MPWETVRCHPTVRKKIRTSLQRNIGGRTSLIYGPPFAGQTSIAQAIVSTHLCPKMDHDFCGQCNVCTRLMNKMHPDVMNMHPDDDWSGEKKVKSEYSINHFRAVQELAAQLPYEADQRFFLIHDAHKMNKHSANSLLKILEEPYHHTFFILITDHAESILPTIRSRCWPIRLIPLDIPSLAQSLQTDLSELESVTIARAAGGLPERATQLLDEGYLEERDRMLGILSEVKARESAIAESADTLAKDKAGMAGKLQILLRLVRDGVVLVSGGSETDYENPDRAQELQQLWHRAPFHSLIYGTEKIISFMETQDRLVNPSVSFIDMLIHLRRAMLGT